MSGKVRVMVCDDSAMMRRLIRTALESNPAIKVVAEAIHGQDALEKVWSSAPDVLVMDVEMPVLDGIDTVREIRRRKSRIPVIMFSSHTTRGGEATLDAIAAGASDYATKPTAGHMSAALQHVQTDLLPKVLQWGGVPTGQQHGVANRIGAPAIAGPVKPTGRVPGPSHSAGTTRIDAIGIGVSTGGPQALSVLVSSLPVNFPIPILIAQHMPPVFTGLLAERLAAQKGHTVREAKDGEEVRGGEILVAPGDHHLLVQRDGGTIRTKLSQDEPENSCRPAVDPLFRTLATCYGSHCLGVVLTGMGKDGEKGAAELRKRGARVFAQDEAGSVVWGMPGNLVRCGLADRVLPVTQIASELVRLSESSNTVLA